MKMLQIEYKDKKGKKYLVEVPEGFENQPQTGIRIGPPDLSALGLPAKYEVALNNQLYDRKLFTLADVRRRPDEIRAALNAALRVDYHLIMGAYKEEK